MPRSTGPLQLQVEGARQLAAIAQRLRQEERFGDEIELQQTLKAAVAPVVREIQQDAAATSRTVASAVRTSVIFGQQAAKVTVFVDRKAMPAGRQNLGQLFEFGSQGSSGRFIRHPVFGNREVWVNQPIRPYFYGNVHQHIPQIQAALLKVVDDMAVRINKAIGS